MNLVTIKSFDNGINAHILKNALESEDIACFIYDENIVTLNPLLDFAVGGVKVKINEEDVEKARKIIHELDEKPYTDEQNHAIQCPNCGSKHLIANFKSNKSPQGIFASIVSLLLMVYPIYYKSVYKCRDCDTEFKWRKS